MKRKWYGILILLLFIAFTTVNAYAENATVDTEKNVPDIWNVFMYVCGSSLESEHGFWSIKMHELESNAPIKDRIAYIFDFGGSKKSSTKWLNDNIDKEQRYMLAKDGWYEFGGKMPKADMGSKETIQKFLQLSNEYSAEHKVLVIWDHGGGPLWGICLDEVTNNRLHINELAEALQNTYTPDINNPPFDIVIFDACLMGSIELAKAMKGYARYMVASEEKIPAIGFDYSVLSKTLNDDPDIDPKDLAIKIADGFKKSCDKYNVDTAITMSVLDLTKMDEVEKAYTAYGEDLYSKTKDNDDNLLNVAKDAYWVNNYGGGNIAVRNEFDVIDLYSLAEETSSWTPKTSENLKNAIDELVIYNLARGYCEGSHGISTYFPVSGDIEGLQQYKKDSPYEITFYNMYEKMLSSQKYDISTLRDIPIGINADDRFMVNVPLEELKKVIAVESGLKRIGDKGQEYLMGMDNRVGGSWETGNFIGNNSATWLTLNGHTISTFIYDVTEKYDIFATPIKVNDKRCNLTFLYEEDTGDFKLLGMVENDENVTLIRWLMEMPKKGDKITIINPIYKKVKDGFEITEEEGDTFVLAEDPKVYNAPLPDGDYEFYFRFINPHRYVAVSSKGKMQVSGGKAKLDI